MKDHRSYGRLAQAVVDFIGNGTVTRHSTVMKSVVLVCFFLSLLYSNFTYALTDIEFLESTAISEFKKDNYETAISQFTELQQQYPNNLLVLRYLGIAMDRAGRHQDAIQTLSKLVKQIPYSAAAHFHLANAYYSAGNTDSAEEHYRRALALSPMTQYARFSKIRLREIGQQYLTLRRLGPAGKWVFYAQTSVIYDNNVAALPDDNSPPSGREASRVTGFVNLERHFSRLGDWSKTLNLSLFKSYYPDEDFDSFEVDQARAGFQLQRKFTIAQKIGRFRLGARYTHSYLGGDRYSDIVRANMGVELGLTRQTSSALSVNLSDKNYQEEGFDPVFSSRDATRSSVSLRHLWFSRFEKVQLGIGAQYFNDDADGLNFVKDGYRFNVHAKYALTKHWRLKLAASYLDEDYPDFVGPIRRETERTDLTVGLTRRWGSHITSTISMIRTNVDSSIDTLSYDRTVWGLHIGYLR